MPESLISILVPVYNCEKYLDHCISSIINQTYQNLQIVLVNDGSTDNSLELCRKYASLDPRIEVYTGPNRGVASARNLLLEKIKGEFFLFVDADDWIEPRMISYLNELSKETNADITVCRKFEPTENFSKVKSEFKIFDRTPAIEKFLYHKELSGALWNKLIRSNLVEDARFEKNIYYGEDALFLWHILQRINRLVISNVPLYHQSTNINSLSHSKWRPERQGTGHIVWKKLCSDTQKNWPKMFSIAMANWAISDMWLIINAAKSNFKKDYNIISYQKNIKSNYRTLFSIKSIDLKYKLVAFCVAYSYSCARLISKLLIK